VYLMAAASGLLKQRHGLQLDLCRIEKGQTRSHGGSSSSVVMSIRQPQIWHGNCRIFSFEQGVKGTRQFMATTYDEFWARYRAVDLRRHHYEIIRELRPCNLYFGAASLPPVSCTVKTELRIPWFAKHQWEDHKCLGGHCCHSRIRPLASAADHGSMKNLLQAK